MIEFIGTIGVDPMQVAVGVHTCTILLAAQGLPGGSCSLTGHQQHVFSHTGKRVIANLDGQGGLWLRLESESHAGNTTRVSLLGVHV